MNGLNLHTISSCLDFDFLNKSPIPLSPLTLLFFLSFFGMNVLLFFHHTTFLISLRLSLFLFFHFFRFFYFFITRLHLYQLFDHRHQRVGSKLLLIDSFSKFLQSIYQIINFVCWELLLYTEPWRILNEFIDAKDSFFEVYFWIDDLFDFLEGYKELSPWLFSLSLIWLFFLIFGQALINPSFLLHCFQYTVFLSYGPQLEDSLISASSPRWL